MKTPPTRYNHKLAALICTKLASGTDSLQKICSDNNFPHHSTVYRWLKDADKPDFVLTYLFAREAQADSLCEEMISIADTFDEEKDSAVKIARARLRIDVRKWKALRLSPKKYGAKLHHTTQTSVERKSGNIIAWGEYRIPI